MVRSGRMGKGAGDRVEGLEVRAQGSGCRFRVQGSEFGCRVQGAGFRGYGVGGVGDDNLAVGYLQRRRHPQPCSNMFLWRSLKLSPCKSHISRPFLGSFAPVMARRSGRPPSLRRRPALPGFLFLDADRLRELARSLCSHDADYS